MDDTSASLEQRVVDGDEAALADLFDHYRGRLRKVIDSRLDRRMQGRIDPSDVLQETFIDLAQKLPSYLRNKNKISMFVWMRSVSYTHLTLPTKA